MVTLRSGLAGGLLALAVLLLALAAIVRLSALSVVLGLVCGVVVAAGVARLLGGTDTRAFGPADLVTILRAALACAVAALVTDSFLARPSVAWLVALAAVGLVLDAVDGHVARRTRTASAFGARFDGEVDAFLILVLSVYVAAASGWWVLAIGLMRYGFAVAGWWLPWLRAELPPRYWRKVVAATQGVVLTVVAAGVLPSPWTTAGLVAALALLVESFARDVWWSWRHRDAGPSGHESRSGPSGHPGGGVVLDGVALLLVWAALVVPDRVWQLTPGAFLRIPVEGLVLAGLVLVLPGLARTVLTVVAGLLLGVVVVVKVLDMGFLAMLDRPFNVVTDRGYLSPVRWLVRDTVGPGYGDLVLAAAALLALAVLVVVPVSLGRLAALVRRHRLPASRVLLALAIVWVGCAAFDVHTSGGQPVASANAAGVAVDQVRAVAAAAGDRRRFDRAVAADPLRDAAGPGLLAGLRGKDVLVVVVESYGRVAVQDSPASSQVTRMLDEGTRRLRRAGYSARSAFLTSPTFGGLSWLAHSTLQTGLWVSDQGRYDDLLAGRRTSLTRLFGRTGWRTVAMMPANRTDWPEGQRFYGFDRVYGRDDIDYRGPRFGFSLMPDQYALAAFRRLELAQPDHAPVMAQIELASSHGPWAPLPRMVDWDRLGDGSVFDRVLRDAPSAAELWRHQGGAGQAYADSISYSLTALISFVETYGDDDLVLVVVGDHQPATVVSGHGVGHDVPVSIVAGDPAVLDRIAAWGWQDGLRPGTEAPVWRMDAFRDRFVDAYSDTTGEKR